MYEYMRRCMYIGKFYVIYTCPLYHYVCVYIYTCIDAGFPYIYKHIPVYDIYMPDNIMFIYVCIHMCIYIHMCVFCKCMQTCAGHCVSADSALVGGYQ